MEICCNPGCPNPATKSCDMCRTAEYCSLDCQIAHWKEHKKSCTMDRSLQKTVGIKLMYRSHQPSQMTLSMVKNSISSGYISNLYDESFYTYVTDEYSSLVHATCLARFVISGPLLSGDMDVDRKLFIGILRTSPLVPVLKAVFHGFPFDMAARANHTTGTIEHHGKDGRKLTKNTSKLARSIFEFFYRGLLGSIRFPKQFIPHVLSQRNISGSPVFIVGLPRTGMRVCQYLLSLDTENNRTPRNWEFLTPDSFLSKEDRVAYANDFMKGCKVQPRWTEFQAEHPAVDATLFNLAGDTEYYSCDNGRKEWTDWNNYYRDRVALFCLHRLSVRQLEAQQQGSDDLPPPKQWIFNDPTHLGNHLEAIITVYPDARFIWMHRNFTDAVSSTFRNFPILAKDKNSSKNLVFSLMQDQRKGMSFRNTGRYPEGYTFDINKRNYDSPPESQEHRFYDCFLDDLLEDPVAELENMYSKWGVPFSEEYRQRICDWKNGNTKRDPITSDTFVVPGIDDIEELRKHLRQTIMYFRRFPRARPTGYRIIPGTRTGHDGESND